MLVENENLYRSLEKTISQMYCQVHAIYEPDGAAINGDCFCTAVDLFKPGFTFKIYFRTNEDNIEIVDMYRWYLG